MLEHLPPNVFTEVITMLNQKDMRALSTTSKLLYEATTPFSLGRLDILIDHTDVLSGIRIFFKYHGENGLAPYLRFVRELRFFVKDPILSHSSELQKLRDSSRTLGSSGQACGVFPKSFGHAARLILNGLVSVGSFHGSQERYWGIMVIYQSFSHS